MRRHPSVACAGGSARASSHWWGEARIERPAGRRAERRGDPRRAERCLLSGIVPPPARARRSLPLRAISTVAARTSSRRSDGLLRVATPAYVVVAADTVMEQIAFLELGCCRSGWRSRSDRRVRTPRSAERRPAGTVRAAFVAQRRERGRATVPEDDRFAERVGASRTDDCIPHARKKSASMGAFQSATGTRMCGRTDLA